MKDRLPGLVESTLKTPVAYYARPISVIREVGLIIDEANDEQQHRVHRTVIMVWSQSPSRSLEDFSKSRRHSSEEGLSSNDRLRIGMVLA